MKPEMRDQIIHALLASFATVGAEDFDGAMQKLAAVTESFLHGIRQLQTVDQVRRVLDEIEVPEEQEKIVLAAFESAPALIGMFVGLLGETAKTDLPRPEAGRPAIDYFKREEIMDFICDKMKEGCNLKQAKMRAATRFQCSSTTIQRVWNKRGAGNLPEPSAIFDAIQNGSIRLSLGTSNIKEP